MNSRFTGDDAMQMKLTLIALGVGIELPRGVLINQGSAGSADLLAGAIQDHQHCS